MAARSASPLRAAGPHAGPAPRATRAPIGREVPGRAAIGGGGAGQEAALRAAMDGSLSLSLDAAALEVMEALELLQQRREQLEQHLRQGWLSLAQARYSLGCHRVSSLQYGATMVPRVRVCHRQDPEGRPHFEEVPGTGGDPQDPDPQQGGGEGLRQRRGAPEKEGTPTRPPPDPLGWFGVLVPPSLRQAQGSFQKGVTLAVEVAELQATMEAAAARYRQLLQQKRHLAGDSGDSQTPTGTPGDSKGDRESSATA
ncbi:LOW QUALITY PROTEIN: coiled-coil domain-containing protein 115 [Cinclus cinclus]|uniref:LOW QUALITY PROTEIN: coiled-coil domain-containing protein 115 n=1 Tax=Cinclus cinclus TaxID=127875 RepID=UPI002E14115D